MFSNLFYPSSVSITLLSLKLKKYFSGIGFAYDSVSVRIFTHTSRITIIFSSFLKPYKRISFGILIIFFNNFLLQISSNHELLLLSLLLFFLKNSHLICPCHFFIIIQILLFNHLYYILIQFICQILRKITSTLCKQFNQFFIYILIIIWKYIRQKTRISI